MLNVKGILECILQIYQTRRLFFISLMVNGILDSKKYYKLRNLKMEKKWRNERLSSKILYASVLNVNKWTTGDEWIISEYLV